MGAWFSFFWEKIVVFRVFSEINKVSQIFLEGKHGLFHIFLGGKLEVSSVFGDKYGFLDFYREGSVIL